MINIGEDSIGVVNQTFWISEYINKPIIMLGDIVKATEEEME